MVGAGWLLWTGCIAVPLQRADTLGAGRVEVAAETGFAAPPTEGVSPTTLAGLAVRVGVVERVDLGGRVGVIAPTGARSYELHAKVQLNRADARFPVSWVPTWTPGVVRSPVLVGIPLPGRSRQLVLGPAVSLPYRWRIPGQTGRQFWVAPSISAGYAVDVGPLRIQPEFALGVVIDDRLRSRTQAALAVGFGLRSPRPKGRDREISR